MRRRSLLVFILFLSPSTLLFGLGKSSADEAVKRHINRLMQIVQNAVVPIYVELEAGQNDQVEFANFGYGVRLENNVILAPLSLFSGSKTIFVEDDKGKRISAKLIGWDSGKSIAVLACDSLSSKSALTMREAQDSVEPQEPLLILIPFPGQNPSVGIGTLHKTDGERLIVSGFPSLGIESGALVDFNGKFAGWIYTRQVLSAEGSEVEEALVAYSAQSLRPTIEQAMRHASRPKGYLGVVVVDWPSQLGGAHIRQVSLGSPAAISGLQVGDIILSINNRKVANAYDLYREMQMYAAGDTIDLRILRAYDIVSFAVILDSLKGTALNANYLPISGSKDFDAGRNPQFIQERIRQLESEISRLRRFLR
ncbi:MAG: PDZ domain-containing protein [candidate division KSB1 bacterium]|nr:PDZ domain-containing protein [candidate division KSB1 bacterium]